MTMSPTASFTFQFRRILRKTSTLVRSQESTRHILLVQRCFSSAPRTEHRDIRKDLKSHTLFSSPGKTLNGTTKKSTDFSQPRCAEIDDSIELNKKSQEILEHEEIPTQVTYHGVTLPLTSKINIWNPEDTKPMNIPFPVFRLMDENGNLPESNSEKILKYATEKEIEENSTDGNSLQFKLQSRYAHDENILNEINKNALLCTSEIAKEAHRCMLRLREMDNILEGAQRQGRISFYMTCRGEEAIHIGAASALTLKDTVWAQYREAGILMWRGFTLEQFSDQCFSNCRDLGLGRQMPVHYGCKALNYHTVSSPLGTQIIQAVGAGYHLKLEAARQNLPLQGCSVVFFGDGASSTVDFHSACNFAATLESPVIFICRNNGFAISTPVEEQYRGDGIVSRASGYGIAGLRVDGNDVFAMSAAIREARRYVMEESKPIIVESMTYRSGHHSTSDDSTRYRNTDDKLEWDNVRDPIKRLDRFLFREKVLNEAERVEIRDEERISVLHAMEKAENKAKPALSTMFEDIYSEKPENLEQQEASLLNHLDKYGDKYTSSH